MHCALYTIQCKGLTSIKLKSGCKKSKYKKTEFCKYSLKFVKVFVSTLTWLIRQDFYSFCFGQLMNRGSTEDIIK